MGYKIIALIGKAGAGKDTLMQKVLSDYPNQFHEIISCTSRPKREGEIEGENYFFLSPKEFEERYDLNLMLEATKFNGWYYGTELKSLSENEVNIGVFNPSGIRSLIKHPEIEVIIFEVNCDDKKRLLRQLNREKESNVAEIIRRYKTDETDFKDLEFNTLKINNNSLEDLKDSTHYILKVSEAVFS